MKNNNLESIIILLATIAGLIVVLVKLPIFNWESVISLVSSLIFGFLYYKKIKK